MCMYVEHWNIFMVNKRDLQQKKHTKNSFVLLDWIYIIFTNLDQSTVNAKLIRY